MALDHSGPQSLHLQTPNEHQPWHPTGYFETVNLNRVKNMIDDKEPCQSEDSVELLRSYSIIIKNLTADQGPGRLKLHF